MARPGQRLLDDCREDCVERGYLLVPAALQDLDGGDAASAYTTFSQATEIGSRFGERDLEAMGQLGQGQALIALGEESEGVAMLDEAMVAVTVGEVFADCRRDHLLRGHRDVPGHLRSAPGSGVDSRPGPLVRLATGPRAVPRTVPGASCPDHAVARGMARTRWTRRDRRASCSPARRPMPRRGWPFYQLAELHRLRGEFAAAEEAYRAGEPLGPGAPARTGAAAAGAGPCRGRGCGDPHRTGGRARPCRTGGVARRVRRHPAGRRRRPVRRAPPSAS